MSQFAKRLTEVLFMAMFVVVALGTQMASALEVGDKAPDFTLQASDGQTYKLSQFTGEQPVVIAFSQKPLPVAELCNVKRCVTVPEKYRTSTLHILWPV